MKENIKFIVTEVNKLLGRNYNVIYFNSLSSEELLQVLKELLIKIQSNQNIDGNVNIKNETSEEISIYILSILRIFHYQPRIDPVNFRQGLVRGDSDIIHPIFTWLLSHIDVVQKRAYLSRFLVKIEVPSEYLSDPEVFAFYEQYMTLIDRFKTMHKEREIGKKNYENTSELTTDLKTMEKEKEAVIIRIEKMRMKAETGMHLLDVARALRIEKDKERDLVLQEEQEKEIISRLQSNLQRLERELQTLKKDEDEITVQTLFQHLSEVIIVQTVVTNEKLPTEIHAKTNRIKALNIVKQYSYLNPDQITGLRNNLDSIAKEIQNLIELKITKNNIDKIEPFRQQAAAVANIKRNVLEKLEKTANSLQELQTKLEEKRELSKLIVEDIPKGEDFKKYINRLKTRGTLYKHCKSELTWFNAENSILYRTAAILENQYNQCNRAKERLETIKKNTLNFTEENASSMNLQLCRDISAFKAKLIPLINEVQTLREKYHEFEQQQEKTKKVQDQIKSNMNILINNLQSELESRKTKLKKDPTISNPGKKIREELNFIIQAEETKIKSLIMEKEHIKEINLVNEKQTQMWNNILLVFKYKIKYAEESKASNGIVVRRGGAETLILQ
ncbi:intraflagellar transport protein 81 homolog isoform X1 [Apis laboriosa]|uniref:intraflagellar transport protein 81 homolog isoform X1 n=1 Tax=Apis laboriosa TaxID=183418 RepID=UPI001CC7DE6D|nr:intraflagellar transport protein 81 homolog isoform X1 [Apis laboriosa]XP_043797020.1 intraflagellar transport protein 81 homolog isoform X1 [Apis laboriosa]XP_043797021.1 intraflagellar transport protein 81 homolog isoform X1 [Apis laboriosa]